MRRSPVSSILGLVGARLYRRTSTKHTRGIQPGLAGWLRCAKTAGTYCTNNITRVHFSSLLAAWRGVAWRGMAWHGMGSRLVQYELYLRGSSLGAFFI